MPAGRLLGSQVSFGLQQILLQVVRSQRQHAPRLLVSLAACLGYLHTFTLPLHMQKQRKTEVYLCCYRRSDESLGILKPLHPPPGGGTQYPSRFKLMLETQHMHSRRAVPHDRTPAEATAN